MLVPLMRLRPNRSAVPQILKVGSRNVLQLGAFILRLQLGELGL